MDKFIIYEDIGNQDKYWNFNMHPIDAEDIINNDDFKDVDVVCYWYGSGSYKGDGYMICRYKGKWMVHDMSHCSCYSELERFSPETAKLVDTIDELIANSTDEYIRDVKPLVDKLKSEGYK